jgi:hypothetical protein
MKEELVGLIYGETDDEARARIESHLDGCEQCRDARRSLEETARIVRRNAGQPLPAPRGLFSPPFPERGRTARLGRAAAVAAVFLAACLLGLSASNAHLDRRPDGWSLRFSLWPQPAGIETAGDASRIQQQVASLVHEQLEREREEMLSAVNVRLENQRQQTLEDLSRALNHQEQLFTAGLRSEKEELLRRGEMVEEMLGSEIYRTRQMLGAVLAASEPKRVAR